MVENIVGMLRDDERNNPNTMQALLSGYAADAIERLRAAEEARITNMRLLNEANAKLSRLRAAGDMLHAWITVNTTAFQRERPSHDKVLSDWDEARRG